MIPKTEKNESDQEVSIAPVPKTEKMPEETPEVRDERRRTLLDIAKTPLVDRSKEQRKEFERIKEEQFYLHWKRMNGAAKSLNHRANRMGTEPATTMDAAEKVRSMFGQFEKALNEEKNSYVKTRDVTDEERAPAGPSTIVGPAAEPSAAADRAGEGEMSKIIEAMWTLLPHVQAKLFRQEGVVEAVNGGGLKAVDCLVLSAAMGATGIYDERADMSHVKESLKGLKGYDPEKVVYSGAKDHPVFDMRALAQTLRQFSGSDPDVMLAPGAEANVLLGMVNDLLRTAAGQPRMRFMVVQPYSTATLNEQGDFEFEPHVSLESFGNEPDGPDVPECAFSQHPHHYQVLVMADKEKYAEFLAEQAAKAAQAEQAEPAAKAEKDRPTDQAAPES